MSDPVGVALIGTGMWGNRLAGILRDVSSLRLVTAYSRTPERLSAFASEFNCEAAPSFEAAIDHPQARGVLLITPNNLHAEQAIACARRGRHVFVDKPIADSLEDSHAIQKAFAGTSLTLLVGHCMRRLGAARKVKQIIDEGRLGQIMLAEAHLSLTAAITPDKWRYYRDTCPGGPLMQLGVHHADTLLYWLGAATRAQGSFARLSTQAEIDDVGMALVNFASGARATIASSYVSPPTFSLRLFGTQANLRYVVDMAYWPKSEHLDQGTSLTLETKAGQEELAFAHRNMLADELDEFARCLRNETAPETGGKEGHAALAIIRAALESHEAGRAVNLEDQ